MNRLLCSCISALVLSACGGVAVAPNAAPAAAAGEAGIDRPGQDYKDFDLTAADPKLCLDACLAEAECKAWTYVKPGVQGDKARCWLKNGVPDQVNNDCCVSGMRTGGTSTLEK